MSLRIENINFPIEFSSLGFYGDGHDGDVTIAVSTTTTLTHDMYYNNLTVNGTLKCNGYKVFVRGILEVATTGLIHNNAQGWL